MMTCWFWKHARYPGEEFHEIVRVKIQGKRQELQKNGISQYKWYWRNESDWQFFRHTKKKNMQANFTYIYIYLFSNIHNEGNSLRNQCSPETIYYYLQKFYKIST